VLYNGNTDVSYRVIGINEYYTDNNALFLIGPAGVAGPPDLIYERASSGFIKNGPSAVALYWAPESEFQTGTLATNVSLIDAVVMATDDDPAAQQLINVLTPGGEQVIEDRRFLEDDESINRCHYGNGDVFMTVSHLSPKLPNICPIITNITLVINEFSLTEDEQYIELWDGGYGSTSLDGYILVIFNESGISLITVDLNAFNTNTNGYFVVGFNIQSQIVIDQ
ncbi:uncharacterized protein LOC102807381, partial [Saccoglossus kowalevskii]|uniref:Uncharacterized protein LOC102807381 n=1 Tax=Saccoglossus kowalevskii TaxID=10224 RepID=A0ABM0MXT1_SACKO